MAAIRVDGLRISEVCSTRWEHVDFESGRVTLSETGDEDGPAGASLPGRGARHPAGQCVGVLPPETPYFLFGPVTAEGGRRSRPSTALVRDREFSVDGARDQ